MNMLTRYLKDDVYLDLIVNIANNENDVVSYNRFMGDLRAAVYDGAKIILTTFSSNVHVYREVLEPHNFDDLTQMSVNHYSMISGVAKTIEKFFDPLLVTSIISGDISREEFSKLFPRVLTLDPIKQYCVVSRESLKRMNGIRGKMMSQAGHAFLHSYFDASARFPREASRYGMSPMAYKITLVVDTDEELRALADDYRDVCGTTVVIDAGATVFNGVPTLTCIGIGPLLDSQKKDSLSLKVLT